MIDHMHLRAEDLAETKRFYRAILKVLDVPISEDTDDHLWCDQLWIDALGQSPAARTHVHLAFQAPDRETVDRFHAAAVAAGGIDNGGPGERPYHPGYHGAFVLDPDRNNVEARPSRANEKVRRGGGDRTEVDSLRPPRLES